MNPNATIIAISGKWTLIVQEPYDEVSGKLAHARAGDSCAKLTVENGGMEVSVRARAVDYFHTLAMRAPLSQVNG